MDVVMEQQTTLTRITKVESLIQVREERIIELEQEFQDAEVEY